MIQKTCNVSLYRRFPPWAAGALIAIGLMFAGYVPAHAIPKAVKKACKYDYKRLCRHYKPGTAKMRACMEASVGQISPRCYDTLMRHGYARRAAPSKLR